MTVKKYAIKIQANLARQGYDMIHKFNHKERLMALLTFEAKDLEDAHKKVQKHIPDELREEPYKLVEV